MTLRVSSDSLYGQPLGRFAPAGGLWYQNVMPKDHRAELFFDSQTIQAEFTHPSGETVVREIEVRTNPITGRTSRIAYSRVDENEPGTDRLPRPPQHVLERTRCPFCQPQVSERTPRLHPTLSQAGHLKRGASRLFPNLFPYGRFSAVSLFDDRHFVEIGTASLDTYHDSFVNAADYLAQVLKTVPEAIYMAITQNHLPSAGGSLVHPHFQVNADKIASNHHRALNQITQRYWKFHTKGIFSDYLAAEKRRKERYIGRTGEWEWVAAYAPEGFYEVWGILPNICELKGLPSRRWRELAQGVLNAQGFYRSLNRNGYNLGLLVIEDADSRLELRTVLIVRSNYAAWVRNDLTGYELMLGDMATFTSPEETALQARPFWDRSS